MGIVAILQKASGPELLLQKQFRPPINKVVIEVPAGLVDEGESAEEGAVRELREETGYVGVAVEVSPIMFNGMWTQFGAVCHGGWQYVQLMGESFQILASVTRISTWYTSTLTCHYRRINI